MSSVTARCGSTDLLSLIERVNADLSPSLAAVAKYALAQGENLALVSVDDIALACHVSKATVVRFCRALGFDGLRSLKQALISSRLHSGEGANVQQSQMGDNSKGDSAILLETIAASIVSTARHLNDATFAAAVRLVVNARFIVWYGTGDSGYLALSGHHRCQINGLNSKATYYPEEMKSFSRQLSENDVVICISRSGRTSSMLMPVRTVQAVGPAIIAITGDPGSPLAQLANYTLLSTPIDLYVDEQRTTLQTTQMSMIDALLSAVLCTRFTNVRSTGTGGALIPGVG